MLQKVPSVLGRLLRKDRSGSEELVINDPAFADVPGSITVESPAFTDDGPLPLSCTDDGDKLSPPLSWRGVPAEAEAVVLIVEDADSPTPTPLVHVILWDLPGEDGSLASGDLDGPTSVGEGHSLGQNGFRRTEYLPPDPPKGHGPHRYCFEVFALSQRLDFDRPPTRREMLDAMQGQVIAKGCLVGTYERR